MGFGYILMIGLTEFANGLDVKRTKGSLAELHGIFARGTEKTNRITIKQVGTYSIKASFRKKIRSSDLDI